MKRKPSVTKKVGANVTSARLRRIALASQGLTRANSFGRGKPGVANTLRHLGYVQIDTISVVARAHHHVLRTRVANYHPEMLDRLFREGEFFEYWSHAAAFLPMADFRFALPRMQLYREGKASRIRSGDKKLMAEVLARIATDGPLMARHFEAPKTKNQGWWDWKPAKRALEQLFMQGDLMVSGREGFQKVYDLTDRVLPSHVSRKMPSVDELARHLVERTLVAHGFSTLRGFTYLRRGSTLRQSVRKYIEQRVSDGSLTQFTMPTGEVAYAEPETLEQTTPRTQTTVQLLSPFDNALIQRDRGVAVFDFDYQIECYVPEGKRKYGYFCLPVLYRDKFVGLADCKAHRKERRFEVKSLYLEEHDYPEEFVIAVAHALWQFADFNECDTLSLGVIRHKNGSHKVGPALRAQTHNRT